MRHPFLCGRPWQRCISDLGGGGGGQRAANERRQLVTRTVLQARAKLAVGLQERDVVGPDKVLRHVDDRGIQADLTVVVRTHLRHVACSLGRGGGRQRVQKQRR